MNHKRLRYSILDFATGFFNAATVVPLLVVVPSMIYFALKSPRERRWRRSEINYLAGLAVGIVFLVIVGLFYVR